MNFGLGFLSVPLFWITQQFGWRGLFLIVGGIGIVFSFVWWALYRNPNEHQTVNQAELDYIEAGGGGEYKGQPVDFKWRYIGRAAEAPAGDRRVDRPVRRQLDAGVLPDVVSDLPGHRARHDLHQGRVS